MIYVYIRVLYMINVYISYIYMTYSMYVSVLYLI